MSRIAAVTHHKRARVTAPTNASNLFPRASVLMGRRARLLPLAPLRRVRATQCLDLDSAQCTSGGGSCDAPVTVTPSATCNCHLPGNDANDYITIPAELCVAPNSCDSPAGTLPPPPQCCCTPAGGDPRNCLWIDESVCVAPSVCTPQDVTGLPGPVRLFFDLIAAGGCGPTPTRSTNVASVAFELVRNNGIDTIQGTIDMSPAGWGTEITEIGLYKLDGTLISVLLNAPATVNPIPFSLSLASVFADQLASSPSDFLIRFSTNTYPASVGGEIRTMPLGITVPCPANGPECVNPTIPFVLDDFATLQTLATTTTQLSVSSFLTGTVIAGGASERDVTLSASSGVGLAKIQPFSTNYGFNVDALIQASVKLQYDGVDGSSGLNFNPGFGVTDLTSGGTNNVIKFRFGNIFNDFRVDITLTDSNGDKETQTSGQITVTSLNGATETDVAFEFRSDIATRATAVELEVFTVNTGGLDLFFSLLTTGCDACFFEVTFSEPELLGLTAPFNTKISEGTPLPYSNTFSFASPNVFTVGTLAGYQAGTDPALYDGWEATGGNEVTIDFVGSSDPDRMFRSVTFTDFLIDFAPTTDCGGAAAFGATVTVLDQNLAPLVPAFSTGNDLAQVGPMEFSRTFFYDAGRDVIRGVSVNWDNVVCTGGPTFIGLDNIQLAADAFCPRLSPAALGCSAAGPCFCGSSDTCNCGAGVTECYCQNAATCNCNNVGPNAVCYGGFAAFVNVANGISFFPQSALAYNTQGPTSVPSGVPSAGPTVAPTVGPTAASSSVPTSAPTATPSSAPTSGATSIPTAAPTQSPTGAPSTAPTGAPSVAPSAAPTLMPTAAPTPSPDACLDALPIFDGSSPFDNTMANLTAQPKPFCIGPNLMRDIFFQYTATCGGLLKVETCAGANPINLDTVLSVYPSPTSLAVDCPGIEVLPNTLGANSCNDDGCGKQSFVSAIVTNQTNYIIRVGTLGGSTGSGLLEVSCSPIAVTGTPTQSPTVVPTSAPSKTPTAAPTSSPTVAPTTAPTQTPTTAPTAAPTTSPTSAPTSSPTTAPTAAPTLAPSAAPTTSPTTSPTVTPTASPTSAPTAAPTQLPCFENTGLGNTCALAVPSCTVGSMYDVTGLSLGAQLDPLCTPMGGTPGPDQWHSFTANCSSFTSGGTIPSGRVFQITVGSNDQVAIEVWTGTCGAMSILGCSRGMPSGIPSEFSLEFGSPNLFDTGVPLIFRIVQDGLNPITENTLSYDCIFPTSTGSPSTSPTTAPTAAPSKTPTVSPTAAPSTTPTAAPTLAVTGTPTTTPTTSPTTLPTATPTSAPTVMGATAAPTSVAPTQTPSSAPTQSPTVTPGSPTQAPTVGPLPCVSNTGLGDTCGVAVPSCDMGSTFDVTGLSLGAQLDPLCMPAGGTPGPSQWHSYTANCSAFTAGGTVPSGRAFEISVATDEQIAIEVSNGCGGTVIGCVRASPTLGEVVVRVGNVNDFDSGMQIFFRIIQDGINTPMAGGAISYDCAF